MTTTMIMIESIIITRMMVVVMNDNDNDNGNNDSDGNDDGDNDRSKPSLHYLSIHPLKIKLTMSRSSPDQNFNS